MKSLMLLWQKVLNEMGTWCCTSTSLDLKKAQARVEHEGLSFLTITLPSFSSDFHKALEHGKVAPDHFTGFQRRDGLPLFLGGFLERVFDRGTGRLVDDPCVDSIFAIRQLTLMFGKIHVPCSDARVRDAITRYVDCDKEVELRDRNLSEDSVEEFSKIISLLWAIPLSIVDLAVYEGTVIPRHGPGSTAERLSGNRKYDQTEWTERLESVFPFGENAIPSWRYRYLQDRVAFLEPGAERPVRVITVPKTLKTPRIIAIEPTAMQYMQQGIMEILVESLERVDYPLKGMIGFTDQQPNQQLAHEGSSSGTLATLDLSEASDRVSNRLVQTMLRRFPHLASAVQATRSTRADVQGHGVIPLSKYASMGSALCFPIEAMVFLSIVFLGIQDVLNRPVTRKDIKSLRGQVRVYGDDIIVPVHCAEAVVKRLEAFGLKVNTDKSYWNGKFRESCGKEYYAGRDVSITRVREVFPARRQDVPEVVSLVSLRNQFYYAGMWQTTKWLDSVIVGLLPHYPHVSSTSVVLGRHSFLGYEVESMSRELQAPLVRGYVVRSSKPESPVSGEGALLKWFLKRSDQPFADRDHLERLGRPQSVNIKLRKAQPF